jgi:hypothetical protein
MATARDIVPGAVWQDNKDVHIIAHGGGMLVHNGQIDGRYLWLPIQFTETGPSIPWQSPWNLTLLDQ